MAGECVDVVEGKVGSSPRGQSSSSHEEVEGPRPPGRVETMRWWGTTAGVLGPSRVRQGPRLRRQRPPRRKEVIRPVPAAGHRVRGSPRSGVVRPRVGKILSWWRSVPFTGVGVPRPLRTRVWGMTSTFGSVLRSPRSRTIHIPLGPHTVPIVVVTGVPTPAP